MDRWVMQYRTRQNDLEEWGDWKNLPKRLVFSSYYAPLCFEFRAIETSSNPEFVFHDKAF